ncbi:MAG: molybdenum cofactor guanylyltransferase [Terracidiphilus sp.]
MRPGACEERKDAIGFVLAGGESRRMGTDKALVEFAGRPLVERALAILREAGLEARIAGARSSLGSYAPIVDDAEPGRGPLGGICAAMSAMTACRAVFLPVDLPLVPASLIGLLMHHAEISGRVVTVSSVNGFAQTFPAVVGREALPTLRNELEFGRGGCFAGFAAAAASRGESISVLPVELAVQAGQLAHPEGLPATRWFLNVNSPDDLLQAQENWHRVI